MSRIADAFLGKKAFVAYLMAGDPNLAKSAECILAVQEAGADLIEIGIPFSDPIAEGPVIQGASIRALSAGVRLDGVFDMIASIKDKMKIPMVFMTYLNPVFVYGYDRFFARCEEIGICGIIIPDMPFEEQDEAKVVAKNFGVEVITLVAPTSMERSAAIVKNAEGFIYLVSSMGVTGVRNEITTDVASIVQEIKRETDLPVAVGFGISTPEQTKEYAKVADGVVVGSAIVRLIEQHGENAAKHVHDYVKELTDAIR